MPDSFIVPASHAAFDAARFAKRDLARGELMFLGLNCFEAGQAQAIHQHDGADKFYLILSGKARMIVGDSVRDAGAGTLIWAPRGIPHGVETAHERTIMLVGMAPPPSP